MSVRQRRALIALGFLASLAPISAHAQPRNANAPGVVWHDDWPRFRAWEYLATGALLAGTAINILFIDWPDSGEEAKNPVDDAVRDALVAKSRSGRDRARTIGDIGFRSMIVLPYLDAVGSAWIGHDSSDVATQMVLMDTESLGLSAFVSLSVEKAARRSRPSTRICEGDDDYEYYCDGAEENASFYSGHMALAVTGAGLTCAHHQNLPLWGGGAGDVLACVGTSAIALTTGVARIVNDRHWATDVLVGGVIGFGSGYLLPTFLHYSEATPVVETQVARFTLAPFADDEHWGAALVGAF